MKFVEVFYEENQSELEISCTMYSHNISLNDRHTIVPYPGKIRIRNESLCHIRIKIFNVQMEFVQVVNEINKSDFEVSCMMYSPNISLNDYNTTVSNPGKIWIRNESMCHIRIKEFPWVRDKSVRLGDIMNNA